MCTQLNLLETLSARLARTAEVFVQLAQVHVEASNAAKTATAPTLTEALANLDSPTIQSFLDWLPAGLPPMMDIIQPEALSGLTVEATQTSGRKRPFDDVFDWFSWDSYYSGVAI